MIFNSISSKHLMTKDATVFFRAAMFLILCGFFSMISHAQISVDYVVVGGGGGAGTASSSQKGGGGGSGGVVVSGLANFSTLVYNITIGGGGSSPAWGTTNNGTNGNPSLISANGFTTITAAGGSKGNNASGGTSGTGGSNGALYGNGGNGLNGTTPNNGGNGQLIVILDTATYYGGGGGGGNWNGSPGGFGNSGLGSIGAGARGQNARSGGTGAPGTATAGTVIIRYASSSALATGGTITSYTGNGTNGTNGVVYQVHKFTADGSFAFNGSTPLPVTMSYFKLNCVEEDVDLIWQTASEHNSDYFQLETSLDAVNWEMIQTIPAAGFSQELINYIAVDKDALRNQKYYRLKQVDFNGDFEIYGPLKADCAVESTNISLHPNPFATEVTLSIASQIPTEVNYTLISPEGKVIENKQLAVQSGITLFTLDVSNYPSGMYMLQFDVNDKRFIKKLTVQ